VEEGLAGQESRLESTTAELESVRQEWKTALLEFLFLVLSTLFLPFSHFILLLLGRLPFLSHTLKLGCGRLESRFLTS
jgi:hypothetical protein